MRLTLVLLLTAMTMRGNPTPLWETDWNTAFRKAKEQHRLVFVDYSASWCGECHDVERITFQAPDLMDSYSDFILLRVDVDRSEIPREYRRKDLPAYIVFDADGRERFRIIGKGAGSTLTKKSIDEIRRTAPNFVRAAELKDSHHDLEAAFLVANSYSSLKMGSWARDSFAEARKIAGRSGDKAAAQTADVQSAFTYVWAGDSRRAIKLLEPLAKQPVNRDTEALIWLLLGRSYEAAGEKPLAVESYNRAQSIAPRGSRTNAEAGEAIARMKP